MSDLDAEEYEDDLDHDEILTRRELTSDAIAELLGVEEFRGSWRRRNPAEHSGPEAARALLDELRAGRISVRSEECVLTLAAMKRKPWARFVDASRSAIAQPPNRSHRVVLWFDDESAIELRGFGTRWELHDVTPSREPTRGNSPRRRTSPERRHDAEPLEKQKNPIGKDDEFFRLSLRQQDVERARYVSVRDTVERAKYSAVRGTVERPTTRLDAERAAYERDLDDARQRLQASRRRLHALQVNDCSAELDETRHRLQDALRELYERKMDDCSALDTLKVTQAELRAQAEMALRYRLAVDRLNAQLERVSILDAELTDAQRVRDEMQSAADNATREAMALRSHLAGVEARLDHERDLRVVAESQLDQERESRIVAEVRLDQLQAHLQRLPRRFRKRLTNPTNP